jgi:SAM-dependent methyltransferase
VPEKPSEKYYRDTARFYDPFATRSDESFYVELAKRYGSPILELACGTGRITFMLAQAGYEIIGIELSPEMREVAQEKLHQLPEDVQSRVSLVHGDITNFQLDRKFSLVIIPTSFKFLLTTEDQLACLQHVYDHLADDGVFILDLYPGEITEPDGTGSYTVEIDGSMVTKTYTHSTDLLAQRRLWDVTVEIIHSDGNVERIVTKSITSIIMPREVDLLVRASGFEIVEDYGGNDFSEYRIGDWKRVLVLKKNR